MEHAESGAAAAIEEVHALQGFLEGHWSWLHVHEIWQRAPVLTVFASSVLPMTLIAGIYGMNFPNMPEQQHPLGYPMALGLMATSGVGIFMVFKRKSWV